MAPTNDSNQGRPAPSAALAKSGTPVAEEVVLEELIAQLEDQRTRLEQVRERARRQGGPEGERLEARATARLWEIEKRIADLRTSLE